MKTRTKRLVSVNIHSDCAASDKDPPMKFRLWSIPSIHSFQLQSTIALKELLAATTRALSRQLTRYCLGVWGLDFSGQSPIYVPRSLQQNSTTACILQAIQCLCSLAPALYSPGLVFIPINMRSSRSAGFQAARLPGIARSQ